MNKEKFKEFINYFIYDSEMIQPLWAVNPSLALKNMIVIEVFCRDLWKHFYNECLRDVDQAKESRKH